MSADLHLYALPATEQSRAAIELWESTSGNVLDGTEEELDDWDRANGFVSAVEWNRRAEAVFGTAWSGPNIWIGQVSWMKAGLWEMGGEDGRSLWIPTAVSRIQKLTDGGQLLTPSLATAITVALNAPDRSHYGRAREISYSFDPERHWGGNGRTQHYRRSSSSVVSSPIRIQKYRRSRGMAKRQHVRRWLDRHLGELVYPESL